MKEHRGGTDHLSRDWIRKREVRNLKIKPRERERESCCFISLGRNLLFRPLSAFALLCCLSCALSNWLSYTKIQDSTSSSYKIYIILFNSLLFFFFCSQPLIPPTWLKLKNGLKNFFNLLIRWRSIYTILEVTILMFPSFNEEITYICWSQLKSIS